MFKVWGIYSNLMILVTSPNLIVQTLQIVGLQENIGTQNSEELQYQFPHARIKNFNNSYLHTPTIRVQNVTNLQKHNLALVLQEQDSPE